MKHIIIGTAGHVDHGKTCLTRALTGVDTHRLQEERQRGITIEIGFAPLTLPNGQTASIVDVPGHERFIRNMLVGAAGMDVVLLVIAADEGFMPQTREHLGILSLLGVQNGILVITKADMVEPEWLEAIAEEAREDVAGTFLADAPMVAVSSHTGQGIPELKQRIMDLVAGAQERNTTHPFRLPIDRVFSADGFGTIVTGTLTEGTLAVGDEVSLYPAEIRARVRGLQNHAVAVPQVSAGMRVAVNLAGVDKAALARGDCLAKPHSLTLTSQADVSLTVLKDAPYSIQNDSQLHCYHGTRELLCKCVLLGRDRLDPGEQGFAQLRFSAPLYGQTGDHFVVRFFSPMVTVGGGVLLNLAPQRHRRNDPQRLAGLSARASGSGEQQLLQALHELDGTLPRLEALAQAAGLRDPALTQALIALLADGRMVDVGGRYLSSPALQALAQAADALLTAYHRAQPLQPGMNRGEFRGKLLPKVPAATADALIDYFAATHRLRLEGPTVAKADFVVVWSDFYANIRAQLTQIYLAAGLSPENSEDVEASFGAQRPAAQQVAQRLLYQGELVALSPQLRLHATHYEKALACLYALFAAQPELTLAAARDALGVSRKYALALLEYWDGTGVTRKVGETRILLKKPPMS